jgi:hypothetical protein
VPEIPTAEPPPFESADVREVGEADDPAAERSIAGTFATDGG